MVSTARSSSLPLLVMVLIAGSAAPAGAARTLVLPLKTVGVSDTTAAVARDILAQELDLRGADIVATRSLTWRLPAGADGCDERDCARRFGQDLEAEQVVYGSLSRLGDKILVQVECLRLAETAPFYRDRLSSLTEEDLDTVMLRVAEGIAAGRPNSDLATVGSVTEDESRKPRRRATRRGLGFRGGALVPTGDSYGGSEGMTSLQLVYKFETNRFLMETTSLLGLAWGDGNVEWTLLDIFAAKIFGEGGDLAPYLGGGLGLRAMNVERKYPAGTLEYEWETTRSQSATSLSLDVGAGLMLLRTYDTHFVVELRYHYVAEDFEEIGGQGAHGFLLTFGTSR